MADELNRAAPIAAQLDQDAELPSLLEAFSDQIIAEAEATGWGMRDDDPFVDSVREMVERTIHSKQVREALAKTGQLDAAKCCEKPAKSIGEDAAFRAMMLDYRGAGTRVSALRVLKLIVAYIDGLTAAPAQNIDSFKMDSGHTLHREAGGNGHEWVLCYPDGSAVRGLGKYERDFVNSALRAGLAYGRTAGAAPDAAKNIERDAVGAMLWLYRRLPRGYERPPIIENPIRQLAKLAGYDLKFVEDSFSERAAAPSPQENTN